MMACRWDHRISSDVIQTLGAATGPGYRNLQRVHAQQVACGTDIREPGLAREILPIIKLMSANTAQPRECADTADVTTPAHVLRMCDPHHRASLELCDRDRIGAGGHIVRVNMHWLAPWAWNPGP